ncbi:hypothetical protein D910_09988 [Dendroctonus ponderosae]|uniref:UBX domain-containing protein n=1 Tax=Dendroctonus ponderosae TaxID=77166 RepID=U4UR94_DENPD|nr:hypothetical protein D910_09988 [Dendroctonus ponderosae]
MSEKIADKVKNFFQKAKADAKFKKAGPGRKLTESPSSSTSAVSSRKKGEYVPPQRSTPSDVTRQSAAAALARMSDPERGTNTKISLSTLQDVVRREFDSRNTDATEVPSGPKQTESEASPHLAVQDCVNILCRYIDNIIGNPSETKFHRIRCSNAAFADKVVPVLGATEFLHAAGFRQQKLEHNGAEEDFLVWSQENAEGIDTLEILRDALKSENRIELELDRNTQVLTPAQAAVNLDLPKEFYAISAEEIKREQQTRIRFPDGVYLQGTFSIYEKLGDVFDFVRENLEFDGLPFLLNLPTGQKFAEKDLDVTLVDLRLVPATILIFQWDPKFEEEIKASGNVTYLKPEVVLLMQQL